MADGAGQAPWRYAIHGVAVTSNVTLPTLREAGVSPGAVLTLRHLRQAPQPEAPPLPPGEVLRVVPHPESAEPLLTVVCSRGPAGAASYLLRFHGDADFVLEHDGRTLRCLPLAGAADETLEQLLIDQVLPKALALQGRLCLHASAVAAAPGGALAFLGPSGSGKSTLAAALVCAQPVAPGGRLSLLSDDCLAVELQGAVHMVHPGYASVRLRLDAAEALLPDTEALRWVSPRSDKLRVELNGPSGAVALAGVFVLAPARDDRLVVERLPARDAVVELVQNAHRLDHTSRAQLEAEFGRYVALASAVPVHRLRIPHRGAPHRGDWTDVVDAVQGAFARASR